MRFFTFVAAAAIAVCTTATAAPSTLVETRAYYSTNPGNGVGQKATINIDGEFTDWNESMLIATCGANDMCTAFHGAHENSVMDLYALYAAWDDKNLYVAWQCCNTGDTWAREGDGPLTDYGRINDVPFILALSVNPTKTGMTGHLDNGNFIWGANDQNGVEFTTHADYLLFMSGKVGLGEPAVFTGDSKGTTNYGANCRPFRTLGITYKMKEGFLPTQLWRQRYDADWADATTLISDPSVQDKIFDIEAYDNLLGSEPVEGLKPHDTKYDSFYEIAIPLTVLGIDRTWLEANGIGCRIVGTRGESGIDCCPWDPSMMDNVFEQYAKDNSTSHEKDDIDNITYEMASIGKIRDIANITPPDPVNPDPEEPDDPVVNPTTGNIAAYLKADGWNAPCVYFWDKGNGNKEYAGKWPGTKMTRTTVNGEEMWGWSISTEDNMVSPMIIFNNNGASQTADLQFVNHSIYNTSGAVIGTNAVNDISVTDSAIAPVYYNLQGVRVEQPVTGQLYIVRQGNSVTKQILR